MTDFGVLFVVALVAATATRLWLAGRPARHVTAHRAGVPAQSAGEVSLAEHQKAADYTAAKTRFAMIGVVIEALVALALTFGGGLQLLHELSAAWLPAGIARGVLLIVLVGALLTLLDVPFD